MMDKVEWNLGYEPGEKRAGKEMWDDCVRLIGVLSGGESARREYCDGLIALERKYPGVRPVSFASVAGFLWLRWGLK